MIRSKIKNYTKCNKKKYGKLIFIIADADATAI